MKPKNEFLNKVRLTIFVFLPCVKLKDGVDKILNLKYWKQGNFSELFVFNRSIRLECSQTNLRILVKLNDELKRK